MSSVDDDTLVEVLAESEESRLTTTEIADELPLARGTVRSRLQALADEGRLDREREGRDVVWFLPDRGDERAPEPESDADEGDEEGAAEEMETGGAGGEPPGESEDETGADAEPTAVTERGETVPTGGAPSTGAAPGSPVARPDENTLVRAAIAGVLLAVVYYVFRRIRDGT